MYVENVTEMIAGRVIASTCRKATESEIAETAEKHARGECDHKVIKDEYGYMYDIRSCAICGKFLDLI